MSQTTAQPSSGNENAGSYEPKPALRNAGVAGFQVGGAGLLVSAVQNALESHGSGAWGVFTRTGGTVTFFATMGATFGFTDAFVANIRETDDALNGAAGGCATGFVAGLRARSLPMAVISCASIATLVGAFDAFGSSLKGDGRNRDTAEMKEWRRRQFFKEKSSFPLEPLDPVTTSS